MLQFVSAHAGKDALQCFSTVLNAPFTIVHFWQTDQACTLKNALTIASMSNLVGLCPDYCKYELALSGAGSHSGHAMQFYSWQQFRPVGPPLVEPKWIQWDPDVTVAALAYPDSMLLCRVRPTFKPIASLSIQVNTRLRLCGLRPCYLC